MNEISNLMSNFYYCIIRTICPPGKLIESLFKERMLNDINYRKEIINWLTSLFESQRILKEIVQTYGICNPEDLDNILNHRTKVTAYQLIVFLRILDYASENNNIAELLPIACSSPIRWIPIPPLFDKSNPEDIHEKHIAVLMKYDQVYNEISQLYTSVISENKMECSTMYDSFSLTYPFSFSEFHDKVNDMKLIPIETNPKLEDVLEDLAGLTNSKPLNFGGQLQDLASRFVQLKAIGGCVEAAQRQLNTGPEIRYQAPTEHSKWDMVIDNLRKLLPTGDL